MKKLSRIELKFVKGGSMPVSDCSAKCKDGSTVSCSGTGCTASDADKTIDGYCTAGGKTKNC